MEEINLVQTGVAALVVLSGIMAIIFVNYIKKILDKIDSVEHIRPLIDRVEKLVDKVERIFTTLEVMKQTTELEMSVLKDRIRRLESKVFQEGE